MHTDIHQALIAEVARRFTLSREHAEIWLAAHPGFTFPAGPAPAAPIANAKPCQGCPPGPDAFQGLTLRTTDWPDYVPPTGPLTRNLLYHLYPVAGSGIWQWNVDQIMQRIAVFNGKRVVGIVTDKKTDSIDTVKAAFAGEVDEFHVRPNDRALREVATFTDLFEAVPREDPNNVTFYAHGKGVHRGPKAKLWAEIMYATCLDYLPLLDRLFATFPTVGTFKKAGHGFKESPSTWHYSGAFFWFHNATLFTRDWQTIDRQWFGIEPYPSLHFDQDEAGCLFLDGKVPTLDLYSDKFVSEVVAPKWEQWKLNHSSHRTASAA